jgi:hypothetical protein
MFKKEFIDIVSLANRKAEDFYYNKENNGQPNPFYLGFGSPNSDLLILGKEKGFDPNKIGQLELESIKNPIEWLHYVKNKVPFNKNKFHSTSDLYLNSYFPYSGKMASGHTWSKYNKLTSELFDTQDSTEHNSFLKNSFISEVNHEPSKLSKYRKFNFQTRLDFLRNPFYKSFKTTVLGCGNYLPINKIEEIFDVSCQDNFSEPREKLVLFSNGNRKLVLTRQLSMDVSDVFISKIVSHLK